MIKKLISKLLIRTGLKALKKKTFDNIVEKVEFMELALEFRMPSKSQLYQDLFVLIETRGKRKGFFVEFGAADGQYLSNTYLLEKHFEWSGIVAEPAKTWLEELSKSRKCKIDTRCVWRKSGEKIEFNETKEAELSTINHFSSEDDHTKSRENGIKYFVETVSLVDLLDQNNAPKVIDYLSIDTEGSEYEILAAFDFEKYNIRVITCEHNYTENREKIYTLLTANGYLRKYTGMSKFDDWYVRS